MKRWIIPLFIVISVVVIMVAFPKPAETPAPAGGAIQLLAVTENETQTGLLAYPVDPVTLANLPGYAPISFGHHYAYVVSRDRQTLAVIAWPSGSSNLRGTLHLIDLNTWSETVEELRLDNSVSDLAFDAGGKALYWMTPAPRYDVPAFELRRYDLERHELSVIAEFPASFAPWQSHRLSSGELAIFGVPIDSNYFTTDAAHVLFVDPAANNIAADVRLEGIKAGQYCEQAEPLSGSSKYTRCISYFPGLAWDTRHGFLYAAHADEDEITVVDLITGSVTKQSIGSHASLEAISGVPESAVVHESRLGFDERAVLSDDGERLYLFSQATEGGGLKTASLQVVATGGMFSLGPLDELLSNFPGVSSGMRQVVQLDGLLTDFALTPDEQSILVAKGEIASPFGFEMSVTADIYVLDAETLEERAHLVVPQANQLQFDGFSPDGRYAYVRGSSAQWVEGSGWRGTRGTVWYVIDLNSDTLVSTVEIKGGYADLLQMVP